MTRNVSEIMDLVSSLACSCFANGPGALLCLHQSRVVVVSGGVGLWVYVWSTLYDIFLALGEAGMLYIHSLYIHVNKAVWGISPAEFVL